MSEKANMHRNFSAWYSTVDKELNGGRLRDRWAAAVRIADTCGIAEAGDLVRVFYSRHANEEFVESLRNAIRKIDDTYIVTNDRVELAVVCGAAIAHVLQTKTTSVSDVLATMIMTMEFGARWAERIPELVEIADQYLGKESVRVRQYQPISESRWDATSWTESVADVVAKAAASDATGLAASLKTVLQNVGASLQHLKELSEELPEMQTRHQERSDMLWWLISEHANTMDSKFKDLKPAEAPFVLARDLSRLTKLKPGPLAVPALLKKALGVKKLTIGQAIDSLELGWRSDWATQMTDSERVAEFCPCLFSLCKSVEAGGSTEWRAACKHVTGIDPDLMVHSWRLAHQVYRELEVLACLKA
jgi:hypothetical protein